MKFSLRTLLAVMLTTAGWQAHAQISDGIVKIGVLNDMSGLYADIGGPGSVVAAILGALVLTRASRASGRAH